MPAKKNISKHKSSRIIDEGIEIEHPNVEGTEEEKKYYFKNSVVEALTTQYVKGGCTDVKLRDKIMVHAMELIRQIIRTHNFNNIYPGHDPASFGDLFTVAWIQLEKVLYKFNYGPGHTKLFNLWSQVCKTVILAHIKREMRDKKNYGTYKGHLSNRNRRDGGAAYERFLHEARDMHRYDEAGQTVINALEKLYQDDEKPHDGLISKLVKLSGLSRQKVTSFLKQLRLRSLEFTDSPLNQQPKFVARVGKNENEEEDDEF